MSEYEFTLIFALPHKKRELDVCIESLAEHGCDDATIGIGKPGRIALWFTRHGDTAAAAVLSAIGDAQSAIPEALLIEVTPDYVGVTEVAETVGCSRQNIRNLLVGAAATPPAPVHEGSSAVWHLAVLLRWLRDAKRYRIADDLLDLASTTMQVNIAIEQRHADVPVRTQIDSLLA